MGSDFRGLCLKANAFTIPNITPITIDPEKTPKNVIIIATGDNSGEELALAASVGQSDQFLNQILRF